MPVVPLLVDVSPFAAPSGRKAAICAFPSSTASSPPRRNPRTQTNLPGDAPVSIMAADGALKISEGAAKLLVSKGFEGEPSTAQSSHLYLPRRAKIATTPE